MNLRKCNFLRVVIAALSLGLLGASLIPSTAAAQQKLEIKSVAEKKLKQLPAGALFWRVENFSTFAQAQAEATAGESWPPKSPARSGSSR
jgi:hypothetical protein